MLFGIFWGVREVSGIVLKVLTSILHNDKTQRKVYLHCSYCDQSLLTAYVHYVFEGKCL